MTTFFAAVFAMLAAEHPVHFELASGSLQFAVRTGEEEGAKRKYMPAPMPGGLAIFDYNGDGRPDVYFTNGAPLPGLRKGGSPLYRNRLFRNDGMRNGKLAFTDVTDAAGLGGTGYDIGAAVADFDNDGHPDLFVAGINRSSLYRNNGNGTFTDVTARSGIETGWAVAGAWVDVNRDGLPDLFIVQYLQWDPVTEPTCQNGRGVADYCSPRAYKGMPNKLYLNRGGGRFENVSEAWGISKQIGKGMGAGVADFDHDGLPDLFVANDTEANFLFHNAGGRFEEVAFPMAVGLVEDGSAVSGMGLDFRDIDNDGYPDIGFVALVKQTFPLFLNLAGKGFREVTYPSGLRTATLDRAGFGAVFADFNNDGWKEIFVSCGDILASGRQANAVFQQTAGRWTRLTEAVTGLTPIARHRGLAVADLDGDGRLDAVATAIDGPAEVWMNRSAVGDSHWLSIGLRGTKSNRDGIGARIRVRGKSGAQQFNHQTSSVGYASSFLGPVHFGMGGDRVAEEVEVRWPSGAVDVLRDVVCDRVLLVREGEASGKR